MYCDGEVEWRGIVNNWYIQINASYADMQAMFDDVYNVECSLISDGEKLFKRPDSYIKC